MPEFQSASQKHGKLPFRISDTFPLGSAVCSVENDVRASDVFILAAETAIQ